MDQVVTFNRFRILIRKKGESVTGLLLQVVRFAWSVDADRNGPYSDFVELIQASFDTPQLGVAGWSPVTSVENEQHAFWRAAVNR